MSAEFTILKAALPPDTRGGGNPKSPLRVKIEELKVGQVLQWRPLGSYAAKAANSTAVLVRKTHGYELSVRKVDGGNDIYRTA